MKKKWLPSKELVVHGWAGHAFFAGQYSLCLWKFIGNYSYYTFNLIVIVKKDPKVTLDIY